MKNGYTLSWFRLSQLVPNFISPQSQLFLYVMRCAIWYHSYNLKKAKNAHGEVLLLVKLQSENCNFTKSNNSMGAFHAFCIVQLVPNRATHNMYCYYWK